MRQIPVRSQTEARLRRGAGAGRLLYRSLENSGSRPSSPRPAPSPMSGCWTRGGPSKPVRGGSIQLIVFGLLIGLAAAVGIALVFDRFDPRFRYPDQVSKGLGLADSRDHSGDQEGQGLNASQDEAAQVVEAFRSIRMSLAHSFDPSGPSSSRFPVPPPGDGKSLIASNLALSFAEAGYRTVLVDGDIRAGRCTTHSPSSAGPGSVDHLAGDATLAAILRPATHALPTLVPCGSRRHLGPELLAGSARMRELMVHLKSTYQVVIVDTPPLGAGIDPFVLSTVTVTWPSCSAPARPTGSWLKRSCRFSTGCRCACSGRS